MSNHCHLPGANFKVVVVHVDGGHGATHRTLLYSVIRKSFSSWCWCSSLADLFDLCLLLLSCLTCCLQKLRARQRSVSWYHFLTTGVPAQHWW